MVGGGTVPQPGEISLAHHGVEWWVKYITKPGDTVPHQRIRWYSLGVTANGGDMTDDQKVWFVNGATWALVVLRDMGTDVDEGKFIAFLAELADGKVTRTSSPAELALQAERDGVELTDEMVDNLHRTDKARRQRTAEVDRKSAEAMLEFYGVR